MSTSPCENSQFLNFLYYRLYHSSNHVTSCDQILKDYAIREINLLLWLFFIGITALLIAKLFIVFKLWYYGSCIPGPPSPSFCGHSILISDDDPHRNLTEILDQSHANYGSIIKLWLNPTQLLVKRKREALAFELNGRLLEKANAMTDRAVDSVMERICGIMDKGTVDCEMFSQHMAFSILGATLFGDMFFAWSKANAYEELLMRIAKDASFWASYNVPPFWKQGYWKYQHLCANLKTLTHDIVQQCQLNYKLLFQANCSNNSKIMGNEVASGMNCSSDVAKLKNSSSQELCCSLNQQEEHCGYVMGMMFHGCLTTAGLISNILARLSMHPEIQQKIYSEIVAVKRRSDKPNQQSVAEMHLLLATLYESVRLLPAGPLLQRCSLYKDLNLKNGLKIPAGALLVAPIQMVQTDENNWGSDARMFNPYRFLSKSEKNFKHGVPEESGDSHEGLHVLSDPFKNSAFLPFGSGLRACVGQRFAIMGVASIFASLLEQYEIKLLPGSGIEYKPVLTNCVLQLVPSPNIVFVRRA